MGKTRSTAGRFWFNAGLSLSVAGMPWTAAISVLGSSTIAALTSAPAQAAMLSSWEFDPTTQALMVTVPGGTTPRYFLAAEPARIVLDLPNTEVGTVPLQQTYGGAIREIRVAQFEPEVTRIVLELAPGTVLAPGHVELQQVEEAGEGNRWVLRPLVATNASVAMNPAPTPADTAPAPASTSDFAPPTSSPTAPAPSNSIPAPAADLPPLEPGATEIPVEPPPDAAADLPSPDETIAPAPLIGMGTEAAGSEEFPQAEPTAERATSQVTVPALPGNEPEPANETSSERSEAAQPVETTRPESVRMPFAAESPDDASETAESVEEENRAREATVSGSPEIEDSLQHRPEDSLEDNIQNADAGTESPSSASTPMASLPVLPEATPSPLSASPGSGAVTVPALEATPVETQTSPQPLTPTRPQAAPQPVAPASTPTAAIEFGQPLPKSANSSGAMTPGNSIAYSSSNPILLPSGTSLRVRYTGEEPLELAAGEPQQEVLVLAEAVHDEAGNVVLPEGSYVVGRFETGEAGSRFITQAISVEGRSLILNAESESLSGQSPSQNDLLRNSALGVAAGVALGFTGIGLIPAIAAGAATAAGVTFLPNSGSSNVVQPDQVLEVRLTQDLTQVN